MFSRLLDKSKMKIHILHRLYTQEEADETEAFYQLNFECVNTQITGRTKKEYYLSHKDKANETAHLFYEKNKKRYAEKNKCECGSIFRFSGRTEHIKTKKHQKYLNQK
jgi:predicted DNA-binding WGR domain protein